VSLCVRNVQKQQETRTGPATGVTRQTNTKKTNKETQKQKQQKQKTNKQTKTNNRQQ